VIEQRRQMIRPEPTQRRSSQGGGEVPLSPAESARLLKALGKTTFATGEELVVAAEEQRRTLEAAQTQRRSLESNAADETRQLREEVASLRSQNRIAARERELDRRDAAEEAEYERDFEYRFGRKPFGAGA
jgi:hypothetical protein